jgi:hypothetical protein
MATDTMPSPAALAWAEEILARHGIAVVPRETVALVERILAAPALASPADWQAALYAIHACPWPADSLVTA